MRALSDVMDSLTHWWGYNISDDPPLCHDGLESLKSLSKMNNSSFEKICVRGLFCHSDTKTTNTCAIGPLSPQGRKGQGETFEGYVFLLVAFSCLFVCWDEVFLCGTGWSHMHNSPGSQPSKCWVCRHVLMLASLVRFKASSGFYQVKLL